MKKPTVHVGRIYDANASICSRVRVDQMERLKPVSERRMVPIGLAHRANCGCCLRRIALHDIKGAA